MTTLNPISSNHLLNFTLAAAIKVKSLIDEEGNPHLNLRVFITGGGCSGFQYGFTFDENVNADDIVVEKVITQEEEDEEDEGGGENGEDEDEGGGENGEDEDEGGGDAGGNAAAKAGSVKLLIDPMSFQYLQGAEIDYEEKVSGAQFVIRNPNAKTTCGCGSSFAI